MFFSLCTFFFTFQTKCHWIACHVQTQSGNIRFHQQNFLILLNRSDIFQKIYAKKTQRLAFPQGYSRTSSSHFHLTNTFNRIFRHHLCGIKTLLWMTLLFLYPSRSIFSFKQIYSTYLHMLLLSERIKNVIACEKSAIFLISTS